MIITTNNTSGCTVTTHSDYLGRWCAHTLLGKASQYLTVISLYKPCQQSFYESNHIRTLTIHTQQTSILRSQNCSKNPCEAFDVDLSHFLQNLRKHHHKIIIALDFNSTMTQSTMQSLCSTFSPIDAIQVSTGIAKFSTYARGNQVLDYVLMDADLQPLIVNGCYEPFQFWTRGDHRTSILDLNFDMLFGTTRYQLATPQQREFVSTDLKSTHLYIKAKHQYLSQHNFESRLAAAESPVDWNPEVLESLDCDFQRSSQHAAKKSK